MPRKATKIILSEKEKLDLQKIVNQRTATTQLVQRSRIILLAEEGKENQEIADILNTRPNTVGKWRNRFVKFRIAGLKDESRARMPAKYGENFKREILEVLKTKPPDGIAGWDGQEIAKVLKCSAHGVWSVLRKEGIQLSRKRSWCVSTDPEFAQKSADIVGLYLNPPENALIISVDEKPSIQAIERQTGYIKCSNGKVVKAYKSTYKRNGTLNLFAALNVQTEKTQKLKREKIF